MITAGVVICSWLDVAGFEVACGGPQGSAAEIKSS
jgi:hypothetical protein